jgi:outer membrane protein OmpA-like peptidoglycan-associated protein
LGEAELGLFGSGGLRRGTSYQVSFFAQGRGAEIKSEKIYLKEKEDIIYEISAKDWIRLEILGGFKSEIKINELELMFKVYSGGATMGNRERFKWSQGERVGEIEGSDEGDFFVGGAVKAAYDLGKGASMFMDARIEKSIDAHNYGADIGVRYKFSGFRGARRGVQAKIVGSNSDYDAQEVIIDKGGWTQQGDYANKNDDTAVLIAEALKEKQQSNSSNPSVAMVTLVYVSSGNPAAVERQQRAEEPLEFEIKQANGKEAQSVRNRAKKIFRLGNRSFGEDSSELTPKAKEEVRQLARQIKDAGFYRILVEGHTDDLTLGGNSLSSLRAQTVLVELRANGIPSNRLSFVDMGASKPLVSNKTSAGRSNNRRIDIFVE